MVCKGRPAVVARFEDRASAVPRSAIVPGPRHGGRCQAGRFDVLVVMDLSRLSRSQGDLSKVIDRLTARGVRVIGVQDGYDNQRRGHKLQAGLSGIIGEAFREMVAERTYTALQSRAMQGRPAGGKRYGYAEGEPETVRQVFEWYADGSLRAVDRGGAERAGLSSPGSAWNRLTASRRVASVGDRWRSQARHRHPEQRGLHRPHDLEPQQVDQRSRHGQAPLRAASAREWIVTEDESARIVPQELWDRVKARQSARAVEAGQKIARGLKSAGGHGPRYLFSGLMRCESCGSSFVMKDKYSYQCSGFVNGKICDNGYRVRRECSAGPTAGADQDRSVDRRGHRAVHVEDPAANDEAPARPDGETPEGSRVGSRTTSRTRSRKDCSPRPSPSACRTRRRSSRAPRTVDRRACR